MGRARAKIFKGSFKNVGKMRIQLSTVKKGRRFFCGVKHGLKRIPKGYTVIQMPLGAAKKMKITPFLKDAKRFIKK